MCAFLLLFYMLFFISLMFVVPDQPHCLRIGSDTFRRMPFIIDQRDQRHQRKNIDIIKNIAVSMKKRKNPYVSLIFLISFINSSSCFCLVDCLYLFDAQHPSCLQNAQRHRWLPFVNKSRNQKINENNWNITMVANPIQTGGRGMVIW